MPSAPMRIWRSWRSTFYDDEALQASKVYTAAELGRIADAGFTGIWIRAILRDLVRTDALPEFGAEGAPALRSLRTTLERCEKAGLRFFLYIQPPRGFPADDPFWEKRPELRGAPQDVAALGGKVCPLCTSQPRVRDFLREGSEKLSRALPGLGGVILITASEFVQHCYSHHHINVTELTPDAEQPPVGCPRCAEREPRDVIMDIIGNVRAGLRAADPNTELIAWNWSWSFYEKEPQARIVASLPRDVTLMLGFERGDKKKILGKVRPVDEYSLSFPGPSKRFLKAAEVARKRGMRVMTKLQFGTTHELATVANLPLIGSLYEKARAMRRLRVRDFMGCWNFGNRLTANTAAFLDFMERKPLPPRRQALRSFAADYFGGGDTDKIADAWEAFGKAMDFYPFTIPFIYYSPINYAVAQPIRPTTADKVPVGRSWMDDVERGESLEGAFGCYTPEEVVEGLGRLQAGWREGLELLEEGLRGVRGAHAREELSNARMVGHCFRSAWNVYRAWPLRTPWRKKNGPALRGVLEDELAHLPEAADIAEKDDRLGFHIECQAYLFTAESIRAKVAELKKTLADL